MRRTQFVRVAVDEETYETMKNTKKMLNPDNPDSVSFSKLIKWLICEATGKKL